jgi:thiamine-phosphate pyrophosphorylase
VRLPNPPLLVITDRRHARGDIGDVAELAFLAGCRWLSLREKDLPAHDQAALLGDLLEHARRHAATVTLHGDPKIVRESGAGGVHLPANADAAEARRLLGKDALIGMSIHDATEARAADPDVLDYVVAGPVFETASKPGYGPALGPKGLAAIVKASPVPVIAVGGINTKNLPDCSAAGARGVAVMGGVMRAKNPAGAVMQLLGALAAGQPLPR